MARPGVAPGERGPPVDGQATRLRIVEAASTLFLTKGFDAVPMSQVAKAAGITTPALYWHFNSKLDLYFQVLETDYRAFFDELVERTKGETARQRLQAYVRTFVELQLREKDVAMQFGLAQLRASLPAEMEKEIIGLQRSYDTFLKEILRQGVEEGVFDIPDLSITTLAIHTMCEYVFAWFKPGHRLSVAEVAELYAEFALRVATDPAAHQA